MLCIQEELNQLSGIGSGDPTIIISDPCDTQLPVSSDTNSSDVASKITPGSGSLDPQRSSWVEGILGCMRPVWTMLSKAAVNEKLKAHQSKYY